MPGREAAGEQEKGQKPETEKEVTNSIHAISLYDDEVRPFLDAMSEYSDMVRKSTESDDPGADVEKNIRREIELRGKVLNAAICLRTALVRELRFEEARYEAKKEIEALR